MVPIELMKRDLFTFGYEGLSLETFLARLKIAGVRTVIDVRANPLSRKKGFSKKALSFALEQTGISYRHIALMGCPTPVRDKYREDGDWSAYTRGFLSHLTRNGEALAEVVDIARASPSCLVCFETDFDRCHRAFVARAAAPLGGFRVKHITAQKVIFDESRMAA